MSKIDLIIKVLESYFCVDDSEYLTMDKAYEALAVARELKDELTPNIEDASQDWAKLDGAVAWHLIERHAENWADVGKMMDEYVAAKLAKPEPTREQIYEKILKNQLAEPDLYFDMPDSHIVKWSIPVDPNNFGEPIELAKPEQEIIHMNTGRQLSGAKNPWVGLTDDEINDLEKKLRDNGDYCSLHFAWCISAKLKEKNDATHT
jgi:hypothetical protein